MSTRYIALSIPIDIATLAGLHYQAQVPIEKLVIVDFCRWITCEQDKQSPRFIELRATYTREEN